MKLLFKTPRGTLPVSNTFITTTNTPFSSLHRMYIASWQWYDRAKLAKPSNMDFSKVTRVNYAFFQLDEDGNIWGTDEWADVSWLVVIPCPPFFTLGVFTHSEMCLLTSTRTNHLLNSYSRTIYIYQIKIYYIHTTATSSLRWPESRNLFLRTTSLSMLVDRCPGKELCLSQWSHGFDMAGASCACGNLSEYWWLDAEVSVYVFMFMRVLCVVVTSWLFSILPYSPSVFTLFFILLATPSLEWLLIQSVEWSLPGIAGKILLYIYDQ